MAMGQTGDSDIKHKNRREYIIIMVVMFKFDIGFIQYLSKAKDLQKLKPLISYTGILMMFCQLVILTLLAGFQEHTQMTWDKGNNRNSFLCHISWHLLQIWDQWSTFYQPLWQKTRLQFGNYNFPHLIVIC